MLEGSLYLLPALKLVGGAYLLWLALQSGRAARRPVPRDAAVAAPASGWSLRGLVLNLSNPKTVVAWMAALAIGLGPEDGPASVAAATGTCIVVGFAVNALYSLVFSAAPARRAYARGRRWIDGVASAFFALAGAGLVRSAFAR